MIELSVLYKCEMFITERRKSNRTIRVLLVHKLLSGMLGHSLKPPIHLGREEVILRAAADQQGGVAPGQGQGHPLE